MIKLCELEATEEEKKILGFLYKPKSLAEICARFNWRSYGSAYQKLSIMEAKKWVKKDKSMNRRTFYFLNKQEIEL